MTRDDGPRDLRVFIADDHPVVRDGLRLLLVRAGGFQVVGDASTVAAALRGATETTPDVVVVEAVLRDGTGLDVIRMIRARSPDTKCLVLTAFPGQEAFYEAIKSGATGYIAKDVTSTEIVDAIRQVAFGRRVLRWDHAPIGPRSDQRGLQLDARPSRDPLVSLSDQDLRILELVTDGLTNREIAGVLFLAEKTVRNYVSSLLSKLNVRNRTQLAAYVAERGRSTVLVNR